MFFCWNLVAMIAVMSVPSLSNAENSPQLGVRLGVQLSGCPAEEKKPWSYTGTTNGPSTWGKNYTDCAKPDQSPIAIDSTKAANDPNLNKLTFTNYDQPIYNATLYNNGYTIRVLIKDGVKRLCKLNSHEYILKHVDFHWGTDADNGTEHSIDGKKYAMEVHFVNIDSTNLHSVVATFLEESDGGNSELTVLQNYFNFIKYKGDRTTLKTPINLSNLIPENPAFYFGYVGSLASPPCSGGVTWFVLPKTISTNKEQMDVFRTQLCSVKKADAEGTCKLVNNIRPIQPTGDRIVYKSN